MNKRRLTLPQAFEAELAQGHELSRARDWGAAMIHLSKAHILGQRNFSRHWRVHAAMLRLGLVQRDVREVLGQLFRLALVPLGHLSGRLPIGNPGHAGINAFEPMPIPKELMPFLEDEEVKPKH